MRIRIGMTKILMVRSPSFYCKKGNWHDLAEDNPANDYPEDEVSSDDEYGHNAYQYRHYASDDEAFDEDEDET